MADAFTSTSATSLGTSLVQTAYDRLVEFELRTVPLFRSIADKRPAQQAMPGSSVVFQIYNDLAPATATLNETVDPDAVAVPSTTDVSVTLNEYGNASLTTRKLELFSLSDVDPAVANIMAYNQRDSLDLVVRPVLGSGSQALFENSGNMTTSGTLNGVTGTDTLAAKHIRYVVAQLRGAAVVPRKGELYYCAVHPDVGHDLRVDTDLAGWRAPHVYSSPDMIWAGEIGQFEGAFFVETPRVLHRDNTAATPVHVYQTYVCGRQFLAEAVAEEPHTVIGNITDKLMRFRPLGWYGVLGWGIFRDVAGWRIETASSIAGV